MPWPAAGRSLTATCSASPSSRPRTSSRSSTSPTATCRSAEAPVKKLTTLRGRTVINLFFESSTRTRTSFELAAKRLSAPTRSTSARRGARPPRARPCSTPPATSTPMAPDVVVVRHDKGGAPHIAGHEPALRGDQRRRRPARAPDPGAARRRRRSAATRARTRRPRDRDRRRPRPLAGGALERPAPDPAGRATSGCARRAPWCRAASRTIGGEESRAPHPRGPPPRGGARGRRRRHDAAGAERAHRRRGAALPQHPRVRPHLRAVGAHARAGPSPTPSSCTPARSTAASSSPPTSPTAPRAVILDQVSWGVAVRMAVLELLGGRRGAGAAVVSALAVRVARRHQAVRQPPRGRRRQLRGPDRRHLRRARAQRRRQVDHAAHDQRHHRARRRRRSSCSAACRPGPTPRPHIGFLPEERGLYPKMQVLDDDLLFMGELRGLTGRDARAPRRHAGSSGSASAEWRQQPRPGPVEGHAAEGAVRRHADPRARAGDPRRAVERPRSDQRRRPARRGARAEGGRPHRPVLDPPDGAGRADLRRTSASSPAARRCSTASWAISSAPPPATAGSRWPSPADADRERAPPPCWPIARCAPATRAPTAASTPTSRSSSPPTAATSALLAALVGAGVGLRRFEVVMPTLHQIFVDRVGRDQAAVAQRRRRSVVVKRAQARRLAQLAGGRAPRVPRAGAHQVVRRW